MGRREFLSVLGATAAAWPLAARGQQPMPVIGFLSAISEAATLKHQVQFRRGLSETGFVPGQNVVVEYRWAEGQYDRLPGMAADLVRRKVDVIAAQAPPAALAARTATTTGRASPTPTGRPASTSAASLWVRNPLICPSCCQRSSISSSTSRPPRHSAFPCHPYCLCAPTR